MIKVEEFPIEEGLIEKEKGNPIEESKSLQSGLIWKKTPKRAGRK